MAYVQAISPTGRFYDALQKAFSHDSNSNSRPSRVTVDGSLQPFLTVDAYLEHAHSPLFVVDNFAMTIIACLFKKKFTLVDVSVEVSVEVSAECV